MLKNKENILLTEDECSLIESINADNQTGRHLLNKRSDDYWNMRLAIENARLHVNIGDATEKEKQMAEYQKQSADYFYWKKLPDDKKLFIEVDE